MLNAISLDHFERTAVPLEIVEHRDSGKFIVMIGKSCPPRLRSAVIGHMAFRPDGKRFIKTDIYAVLKLIPGKKASSQTAYRLKSLYVHTDENVEWLVTKLFTTLAKAGHIVHGWNDVMSPNADQVIPPVTTLNPAIQVKFSNEPMGESLRKKPRRLFQATFSCGF